MIPPQDAKSRGLREHGTLNPRPRRITDRCERGWRGRCRRGSADSACGGAGTSAWPRPACSTWRRRRRSTSTGSRTGWEASRVRRRGRRHSCGWWPDGNSPTVSDATHTLNPIELLLHVQNSQLARYPRRARRMKVSRRSILVTRPSVSADCAPRAMLPVNWSYASTVWVSFAEVLALSIGVLLWRRRRSSSCQIAAMGS